MPSETSNLRRVTLDHQALELDKILLQLADLTCCETARLRATALKPHTSLPLVIDENQKTTDALLLSARFGTPSFQSLSDPTGSLKLAEAGGMLSILQLQNIGAILSQSRRLVVWFSQCAQVKNTLQDLFARLAPDQTLEETISSTFAGEGEISDHASPNLYAIRRQIRAAQDRAKKSLEQMVRSAKYQKMLQETIVTMRDGRFVLPVKAEYKSEVAGLLHDTSGSGATLFVEPLSVVEANNEVRLLQRKEQEEIERILYALAAACAEQASLILENFFAIIGLNLYFAKAALALSMDARMPHINNTGEISLKQARHPLIDPKQVVPIDIALGGDCHTLLITGPNTGGKTVSLKTLGLLTLMTMCGLLIPVGEESVIAVFDHVLVDIGDQQSIEQSLSTFSAHMTNIVSILSQANERSLVLMDELGSGTDPVEGAALAIAILEALRGQGALIGATTHYQELKLYAIETEGVENASCEFDLKTLRPTYRLLLGMPGRSNAFAISARLGLPDSILAEANKRVSAGDQQLLEAISRLDERRDAYEKQRLESKAQQQSYQERLEQVKHAQQTLEAERQKILAAEQKKAAAMLHNITVQSGAILDELEQLRRDKEKEDFAARTRLAKGRLQKQLHRLHDEADPVYHHAIDDGEAYQLPRPLVKGDAVLLVDIRKQASVLELPDKKDTVLVQVGRMKLRVKVENLRLLEGQNPDVRGTRSSKPSGGSHHVTKSAALELDLRGQMVEEALMETDLFIDQALRSGIHQITIIHGKGTGALRRAIQAHLKRHPSIKEHRLGTFGEGEHGVTIAILK